MASLNIIINPELARRGAAAVGRALRSISVQARETGTRLRNAFGPRLRASVDRARRSFSALRNTLTSVGRIARNSLTFVGLAGGAATFASLTRSVANFEQSVADLSAITGSTGESLQNLSRAAREMGATTSFSATQAAQAFTLIASAKPDLLANNEALIEVTRSSLTLAEAAGITLPESASALGESLNQFGLNANEANRVINVLAAGAKFGASQIAETSQALKVAGVSAAAAGVQIETAVAAIQALSTVGIRGSEAGTVLRNIILKLEQQSNTLRPSVVGLTEAIDNLGRKNLTTAQLVRIFGLENVNAFAALASATEQVNELERNLTGTDIAFEQSTIRMNTLIGRVKELGSAWEELAIALREGRPDIFSEAVTFLTEAIRTITPEASGLENVHLRLIDIREEITRLTDLERDSLGGFGVYFDQFGPNVENYTAQIAALREEEERLLQLSQDSVDGRSQALVQTYRDGTDAVNEYREALAGLAGALSGRQQGTTIDVGPVSAALEELRVLNPQQIARRARGFFRALRTPQEELDFQRGFIELLREKINLSDEFADRALANAQKEFEASTRTNDANEANVRSTQDLIEAKDTLVQRLLPEEAARARNAATLMTLNELQARANELGISEETINSLRIASNLKLQEILEQHTVIQERSLDTTDSVVSRYLPAVAALERYQQALEDIDNANLTVQLSERAKAAAVTEYIDAVQRTQPELEQLVDTTTEETERLQRLFENWADNFNQTISSALLEGENRFEDFFNNIARQITQLIVQQQITDPLVGLIGNLTGIGSGGSLLGSLFGSFFGGPVGSFGGAVPSGAPIPLQTGGIAFPNQRYLVGESGPEILQQGPRGGIVTPIPQTRNQTVNSDTNVFNFNISTPNADSFRASQSQILADAQNALSRVQRRRG